MVLLTHFKIQLFLHLHFNDILMYLHEYLRFYRILTVATLAHGICFGNTFDSLEKI